MHRVDVQAQQTALPPWAAGVEPFALSVLDRLGLENWDLAIRFCDDEAIRAYNKTFRHKDEATDILSFPAGDTVLEDGQERCIAGDILISLETLKENSAYFAVPIEEEWRRLVIHGILHLAGRDHATNEPAEPMLAEQEALLAALGTGAGLS